MQNLIGDEIVAIPARLGPGVQPHAYGKAESRPGRKMGHLNRVVVKKPRI
jgi:5-(carboxyamino)imidazole ribonucleotide synthase